MLETLAITMQESLSADLDAAEVEALILSLIDALGEDPVEVVEASCRIGQAEADQPLFAGREIQTIARRHLGATAGGIHRVRLAVDDITMKSVFYIRCVIGDIPKGFFISFIICKKGRSLRGPI